MPGTETRPAIGSCDQSIAVSTLSICDRMPPEVPLALAVVFVADGVVAAVLAVVLAAAVVAPAVPLVAVVVPGVVAVAGVPAALPSDRLVSADRIDCRIDAIEFCPLAVDAADAP